ncbi:MAG: hypothetical protein HFJ59_06125 [Clostridia bacterium]|nr:hypothetical protein [Clostridia bacterium]
MKSNLFKYVFIIFAIGTMIFAIVKIKKDEKNEGEQVVETTEEVQEEVRELKLGVASFDSINPILSQNKNIQDITKIIYEPLVTLTQDYKLEYCLAKEIAKQNDTVYLIKIRDDKKWSDGRKFTADDVKYTIDSIKGINTIYTPNVQNIATVEVVDNTTIRITLVQEVPFFEYYLVFPILSSAYYSDKEFVPDIVPTGTGMYKVSDVQEATLILTKNEYYPEKEELKLNKIFITTFATVGELYNAFKIGNIDLISTQNSSIKDYIGTIGYLSKEMKGREHDFIAFNTQSHILSQASVRKAICYSIDKSNIVSSIYGDNYYTSSFPLDYGNWIYQEQDVSLGYNIEQAKQILVDDGWKFQSRQWQKTANHRTQRLYLNLVVKNSDAGRVNVAENIKNQLLNQGIRVNVIKASDVQYQNYLNNKNYDMILCSMNLSTTPNLTTFFGANNLANYSNEEVNNLMNEAKNTNDDAKLKEIYKRLGEIYKTEMPYLSLYNNKYTVAYNTKLAGTMEPNWFNQFYNIQDWHK